MQTDTSSLSATPEVTPAMDDMDALGRWKQIYDTSIPVQRDPVPGKSRNWKFMSGNDSIRDVFEAYVYLDDHQLYQLTEHADRTLEITFVDAPTTDWYRDVPFDEFLWSLEEASRRIGRRFRWSVMDSDDTEK